MPVHDVVTSNGMSAVIEAQICKCNQCGFKWIKQSKKMPQRCPSRECRSIAWNGPKRPKRKYERKDSGRTKPRKARRK